MNGQGRCHCQSCTVRSFTGPVIVITIGILFLLHQVHGGVFDFGNTWPVILVVLGLLYLASSMVSRDGHIEPPPIPPVPRPPVVPPPPAPPSSQGQ